MIEYIILNSHDATQGDKADFIRLVTEGGAVDEFYVRQGIERPGAKMVFAKCEDRVVGVAALKVPLRGYRNGIESETKSGHPIPEENYPFELGYVAVDSKSGTKGVGTSLVKEVVKLSDGLGLFATSSHFAMVKKILPRVGFRPMGNLSLIHI